MKDKMLKVICNVWAVVLLNFAGIAAEMPAWDTSLANPLVTGEGTWTLAGQTEANSELTAKLEPLTKGMRFDKPAWQWDNGRLSVMEKRMTASTLAKTTQIGPATVIAFQPKEAGKYKVQIKGELKIQIPAAGYAVATVFVFRAGGAAAEEIGVFTTVDATTKRGVSQVEVSLEKDVEVKAGDQIAVRLQARNPGNASSGNAYLTFETYSVLPLAAK